MKILFASQAIDGHFNPMTGVAVRLRDRGHDVRWYTGPVMAPQLQELGIPLLPFKRAIEQTGHRAPGGQPARALPGTRQTQGPAGHWV